MDVDHQGTVVGFRQGPSERDLLSDIQNEIRDSFDMLAVVVLMAADKDMEIGTAAHFVGEVRSARATFKMGKLKFKAENTNAPAGTGAPGTATTDEPNQA